MRSTPELNGLVLDERRRLEDGFERSSLKEQAPRAHKLDPPLTSTLFRQLSLGPRDAPTPPAYPPCLFQSTLDMVGVLPVRPVKKWYLQIATNLPTLVDLLVENRPFPRKTTTAVPVLNRTKEDKECFLIKKSLPPLEKDTLTLVSRRLESTPKFSTRKDED